MRIFARHSVDCSSSDATVVTVRSQQDNPRRYQIARVRAYQVILQVCALCSCRVSIILRAGTYLRHTLADSYPHHTHALLFPSLKIYARQCQWASLCARLLRHSLADLMFLCYNANNQNHKHRFSALCMACKACMSDVTNVSRDVSSLMSMQLSTLFEYICGKGHGCFTYHVLLASHAIFSDILPCRGSMDASKLSSGKASRLHSGKPRVILIM